MARLPIKSDVIRRLFAMSGNLCAEPGCNHELINSKGKYVAEICHIEAANIGGARYNPSQDDETRRSFENLVLLCHRHHVESDEYDLIKMQKLKANHEQKHAGKYNLPSGIELGIIEQVNGKLDQIIEKMDENIGMTKEIRDAVIYITKSMTPVVTGVDIAIYAQQLEFIKDQKKLGSYNTALRMLMQFKEQYWERLNDELKFKTLANIAVLHLNLHNKQEGIKWMLALEEVKHEHADRYAYLALGYGLQKDKIAFKRVFDKAISLGGVNSNIWLGFIYVYEDDLEIDELIKKIPAEQLQKSEVVFTVADLFYRHNRSEEGKVFLENATELEKNSPIFLADIKAFSATKLLPNLVTLFKFSQRQYSENELKEFDIAHKNFTEAWDIFKGTEMASVRSYCLVNRGVINTIFNRQSEATNDFLEAYRLTYDYMPFKNLVMGYLHARKTKEAEKLIKEHIDYGAILTLEQEAELINMKARLQLLKGEVDQSLETMQPLLTDKFSEFRQRALYTMFYICMEKKKTEKAKEYFIILDKDFHNDIQTILADVNLRIIENKPEEASLILESACSAISEKTDPLIILEITNGFIDLKEFDKAIHLLKRLADKQTFNEITRTLIICQFKMGNFSQALELAEPLFANHFDEYFLVDVIMKCHDEMGNFESAIETCKKYIAQPSSIKKDLFRFNIALLLARLKREQEKINVLNEITDFEIFSQDARFQIAYWLGTSAEKIKGLELAYQTRSDFYDDPRAHESYLKVLLPIELPNNELFPSIVYEDCGVDLEDETSKIDHYLISNKDIRGENVIKTDSVLAKALIGHKISDTITFDKGFGLQKKYIIKLILSKYTYALQETGRLFESRFSGQGGITVMKSDPADPFAELEVLLRSQAAEKQRFEELVFEKHLNLQLPLTTIAGKAGENFINAWGNWISNPDFYQVAFACNNEAVVANATARNKSFVLDITVLVFLALIVKSYRILEVFGASYIVAQSVLDEIQQFHELLEQFTKNGRLSAGYQNGSMVSYEISKQQVSEYRQHLSALLEWCRSNTKITAPSKAGSTWKDRDKIIEVIGKPTYDSICLAEESEGVLLCDDAVIVTKMLHLHKLNGVSSYDIVQHLHVRKRITEEDYETLFDQMITANYISLPGSAKQVWRAFDKSEFRIQKPFTTAVKTFSILLPQFAAANAVAFLKQLYTEIGIDAIRTQTTLLVFNELAENKLTGKIFPILLQLLHSEFRLLQPQLRQVLEILEKFVTPVE